MYLEHCPCMYDKAAQARADKQPKKSSQKIKEEKNILGLYTREKSTLSTDLRKPTTIKSRVKFSSDPTDKKLSKQLHKKLLAA